MHVIMRLFLIFAKGLPIPVVAISAGAAHMQYGTEETLVQVFNYIKYTWPDKQNITA